MAGELDQSLVVPAEQGVVLYEDELRVAAIGGVDDQSPQAGAAALAFVAARPDWAERARLDRVLLVDPATRRSEFDRMKTPAQSRRWASSRCGWRILQALDAIGPTEVWLDGVPPGKVMHFAGEARMASVDGMRKTGDAKR